MKAVKADHVSKFVRDYVVELKLIAWRADTARHANVILVRKEIHGPRAAETNAQWTKIVRHGWLVEQRHAKTPVPVLARKAHNVLSCVMHRFANAHEEPKAILE